MTDRLQEIRARLDAATPGPWEVLEESFDYTSVRTSDYSGTYAVVYSDEGRPVHRPDADLIAHAPGDIAYLLDRVEKYRAQLEAEGWIVAD